MTIEPILGYAIARMAQLEHQPPGLNRDAFTPKEAAIEELRRVIVLCEGLMQQELFIRGAFIQAGVPMP